jgi:hypothetical protein
MVQKTEAHQTRHPGFVILALRLDLSLGHDLQRTYCKQLAPWVRASTDRDHAPHRAVTAPSAATSNQPLPVKNPARAHTTPRLGAAKRAAARPAELRQQRGEMQAPRDADAAAALRRRDAAAPFRTSRMPAPIESSIKLSSVKLSSLKLPSIKLLVWRRSHPRTRRTPSAHGGGGGGRGREAAAGVAWRAHGRHAGAPRVDVEFGRKDVKIWARRQRRDWPGRDRPGPREGRGPACERPPAVRTPRGAARRGPAGRGGLLPPGSASGPRGPARLGQSGRIRLQATRCSAST